MDFQNGIPFYTFVSYIRENIEYRHAVGDTGLLLVCLTGSNAFSHEDTLVFPLYKCGRNRLPSIVIGRAYDSDICVSSAKVSKLHAYIQRSKTGWTLASHFAKNGTWVNNVKLVPGKDVLLKEGDAIKFADVAALFTNLSLLSI